MNNATRTASRSETIALCAATLIDLGSGGATALGAWFKALRIVRTTPHRDVAVRFAKAAVKTEVKSEGYASVRRLEMADALEYYAGVYAVTDRAHA
jgi:uncharacterized SAM-dependent methyltransferase